jgi:transcriptional regulator with XRE-family HTH domain
MEQETEKVIDNIRKERIERKISLLKLAIEIGISHSHLFYIESKRVIPSIDVIVKISKAMEINIKDLFD